MAVDAPGIAPSLRRALSFNRTISSNLRVKALSELIVKGGRLLLVIAAARLLGPEQFGLYAFAIAFAMILADGADFGLHLMLAREVARAPEARDLALGRAFRAKAILSLAVLTALTGAALLYPRPAEVKVILILAGLTVMAQSWSDFWSHYFRGLQSLKEEAVVSAAQMALGTGIGIWVLLHGRGPRELFLALFSAGIAANLIAMALVARRGRIAHATTDEIWDTLRAAAPIGVSFLLATIYMRVDLVLLERLRSDAEVGSYGAAYRLFESFRFLPALFMAALFPAFSEYADRHRAELLALLRKGIRWMTLLSLLILGGLLVAAPFLLRLLYGDRYGDAAPLLRLLAPSLLFLFPNYALTHLLVALGAQRAYAVIVAICVPLNIGLNLLAIGPFGAAGSAVVTCITEATIFGLSVLALRRRLRDH